MLALGPRKIPAWRCGPRDRQRAAPETRADAVPFDVLGLRDELERLGYVEDRPEARGRRGRRFVLDLRQGDLEAIKRFAREFARERVDLILAITSLAARAAQEAMRGNPISMVFTGVSDPVREGLAQSLARPGGAITGVSNQLAQGSGKRVELFKEMVPGLRRLLTIYQADFEPAQRSVSEQRKAAAALGITLLERHANNRAQVQAALADVRRDTLDGIILPSDAVVVSNADLVLETSLEQRVPTFGPLDYLADWGALGAYGPSPYEAGRRVAHYVDRIVKGARPGDLRVELLDPIFVINQKAARCLGVSLPSTLLHQANRIIR